MLRFALPFASALLYWICYHPANLWPLAWFVLVPWLAYVDAEKKTWRALLLSYAAGFVLFTIGFGWMRHVAVIAPLTAGFVYAFQWMLFALALRKLRGPRVIALPGVWIALDWLRTTLPVIALPWFQLGHTQIGFSWLAQSADLGGVHLLTALMVAFQVLLLEGVRGYRAHGRVFIPDRAWRISAIAWAGCFVGLIVYGAVRLATLETREGPRLMIVQPNIPQDNKELVLKQKQSREEILKWKRSIYEKHLRITAEGMTESDLLIWPEAALLNPVVALEGTRLDERHVHFGGNAALLRQPAIRHQTPFLCGAIVLEPGIDRFRNYNSALLVQPDGTVTGRYDKVILVPFGEYIPFSALRSLVQWYTNLAWIEDTTAGADLRLLEAGGERFGTAICFEGILPGICRGYAGKGAGFVVNLSNDGWFRDSAELDQILAVVRFRSIENRIGFVRATNTGISALIGPDGTLEKRLEGPEGRVKEVEGVLTGRVSLTDAGSLYRAFGDWFVLLALLVAAGFETGRRIRRKKV